ncbi:Sarcoplasmic calcium-binding protein 1,Sarcoplasmic calcium-binding protein, beta chain,Sarcoplasmic calcium-binding protein, alpha-B and -A chains [Lepeophtheirus salmonis]|uniref:Sarcoplasmic calcium-binding protein 1,Sarcoplasmic calcium-binding protein, beta chain,Sarcoplasmic calcium-binding protein, alpha-B and -A chains n=2 Tax=Lepeophtheirus salmonis TaxID=72036 RepID=A0A7R8CVB6_LEPSM|nr:Sarcoplasmic calcium-binding protein 1,Sarcoplasmic calcium-binding protein, beta chain,Sarcoplasmic calcium-binding protein, alpha-B and -A chains [Lepeophtheirus salmonis]CAF2943555.1 Sarcoplasmic calcium-binding protein 1,Sarcoplasmic calcium-binding protein, beta chain,Sarcoplasmic calcium-binding protein, alpha-B and -A chains [Lepeophtheirus salmonis]
MEWQRQQLENLHNLKRTKMAYSWDNRVKFVVRYMYDIDNNGFLDKNDFECLAVRNTVMETKGKWCADKFKKNQEIMYNLWNEISELADFNKDGEVSVDEFKRGLEVCKGKSFSDLPKPFKFFIDSCFRTIDVDGDGTVGLDEYRMDCVSRMAYKNIESLDASYNKLLNEDDKKKGGITLERYQELYAQFIGNADEACNACHLFVLISFLGPFVSSEYVIKSTEHGFIQNEKQNTSDVNIPTLMMNISTTTTQIPITTSRIVIEHEKVDYGDNFVRTEENERYNYFNVPDEERGNRIWGDPNFTNKHRSN